MAEDALVRRQKARHRVVVGALALLVAAGAGTVALLDSRSSSNQRVNDAAGISYELAGGWDVGAVEPPTTRLVRDDDTEVATITHGPAGGADAVEALADAKPPVCRVDPVTYQGIDGSDSAARCDNPQGADPATAVGAVADDELWVITVAQVVRAAERRDFLASVRLS